MYFDRYNVRIRLAEPDDLLLVFGDPAPEKAPLRAAFIKTEPKEEELNTSAIELGGELRMFTQASRCEDLEQILRPLAQRQEELEGYRARGCVLRRCLDPHSNFYSIDYSGERTIWICNEGTQSLRFQTPDGTIYRVCAGYMEELRPSNARAKIGPAKVLLDLGGNPMDTCAGAVHVRYGESPWQRAELSLAGIAHIDSYACRVFCGDDCLGVLESYSDYFLQRPGLTLLDIGSYGPSRWFFRNKRTEPFPVTWTDGQCARIPPDGAVYSLEALRASAEEGI